MDLTTISGLLSNLNLQAVVNELEFLNELLFNRLITMNDDLTKLQTIMQEYQRMDFINLLLICGQDIAAQQYGSLLNPNIDLTDAIDLSTCDPQNGHKPQYSFGGENKDPVFGTLFKNNVELTSEVKNTTPYKLEGDQRGYCYILINVFTIGTFKEMQRFRNIFHKLKFKVIFRKNLNRDEIIKELSDISKEDTILESQYAFIFLYLGHGNQNNVIEGFDSQLDGETSLPIEDILILFNKTNCPQLDRKPKVFIFNCCRGVNAISCDQPVRAQPYQKIALPKSQKDFITCYSTLDGYIANVDFNSGTIYGSTLADKLEENVKYKDLNTILTKTNNEVIEKAGGIEDDEQPFDWTQNSRRRLFFYLNL